MDAPEPSLRGRSILVTGGSMGIGFACARACASAGANVMICARGAGALAAAADELARVATTSAIATASADVGDEGAVDALFARFAERFGRCDGVIHAAAVLGPIGEIVDVAPEAWWDTLRINLFGTFLVARRAAIAMRPRGGRIVLLSGGGASGPFPNFTAYATSKVATVRFAETIALELGPEIEVNCLAPGFVPTRMHAETLAAGERAGPAYLERTRTELARGGVSPSVASAAAAFLVSDAARGITGKLVSAVYDDYRRWPDHLDELAESDLFTLRRILPRERGMEWQ
jgi:NAD(P)-dependent dehydrogenase (short-subunit alcohol dehydrogenase family)